MNLLVQGTFIVPAAVIEKMQPVETIYDTEHQPHYQKISKLDITAVSMDLVLSSQEAEVMIKEREDKAAAELNAARQKKCDEILESSEDYIAEDVMKFLKATTYSAYNVKQKKFGDYEVWKAARDAEALQAQIDAEAKLD